MGHRLTKIYTRTGDDGTTGLSDGSRVGKDCARVRAMGSIDETNSIIGMMIAELAAADPVTAVYVRIQHDLFDLGGELSPFPARHWSRPTAWSGLKNARTS